jgi:hypothetical protein
MPLRLVAVVAVAGVMLIAGISTSPALAKAPVSESANSRWLAYVYGDILGRQADEGGLDFWIGRIAGGGAESREQVTRTFVSSPEGSRREVRRAYADLLDRRTDAGGEAFWTNFLRTNRVTILRANIIASDEYFSATGDISAFITTLYQEVLGRSADPDGVEYWSGRLEAGVPRWQLVLAIYLSPESLGKRADAYAIEILGRSLTNGEKDEAVAIIRSGGERALRAHFLASDEAFEPYLSAVGLLEADRS